MNSRIYRPVGLVLVVLVTAIFAALGLILCGIAMVLAPAANVTGGATLLLALCFGISVMEAAAAYGLWTFQGWALGFAKVIFIIGLLLSVVALFSGASGSNVIVSLEA